VISPLSLVRDIHSFLALAGRRHDRPIRIDDGFLEECRRLLAPDSLTNRVDQTHEDFNVWILESPAEVTGCRRIRNRVGAKGVQVDLVVSAILQVLEAAPASQQVVGDVQNVVRLVVWPVTLQKMQVPIDFGGQADAMREGVNGTDAAACDCVDPARDLVADVARTKDRHIIRSLKPPKFPQPLFDSPSRRLDLRSDRLLHLKSPPFVRWLV